MKKLLILLTFVSFVFSKTFYYDVYVFFFRVGEIKIQIDKEKSYAEGKTLESMKWLYSYDFRFYEEKGDMKLYEREKEKVRVFGKDKIYEKKPWIPLLVDYLKTGKVKENNLFKVKKEGNKFIVIPLKSKRVKKIILKDGKVPKEIVIHGKVKIKLKLRKAEDDKGTV
ncbi:hypothetical protein [Aquifex aeolicus]|uniref:Uncharacterized protein aq_1581 n=1 Tax=Aquifex aeolicus (strain VF5) TaxID=224324 RepID=Y1581_AQUAE|nr:hypothetical protein [Aquifex aeolicus]O67521.1 RecName: Full=Uncharacterized protein aq_1581 [Aquifex aeolicus VF5]AAC07489.1 putative protein [Aquifex aeolicus VF5]